MKIINFKWGCMFENLTNQEKIEKFDDLLEAYESMKSNENKFIETINGLRKDLNIMKKDLDKEQKRNVNISLNLQKYENKDKFLNDIKGVFANLKDSFNNDKK